jgi:hypothetical protein
MPGAAMAERMLTIAGVSIVARRDYRSATRRSAPSTNGLIDASGVRRPAPCQPQVCRATSSP